MRHLKRGRKLNRTSSHRKSLLSNLSSSLVVNKRIITTHQKAKELQKYVERLVTYAKYNNLHGRRLILSKIRGKLNKSVANELIHKIAPIYKDRSGGYTRVIRLENRKNDNAETSLIEFVGLGDLSNDKSESKPDSSNQKENKQKEK